MSTIAYRAEIDGLRAVAVLAVVLYHFGVSQMSGGFVGVDVFFVISGYLITAILLRQLSTDGFSLADFYRRRALRILPALLFLLVVLCALALIAFTPPDIRAFARSLPAVAAFLSNFYFGQEVNYFDQNSENQILLHTWSLGIEEQFYIFYPIALALAFRFARRFVTPLIWLGILLSFLLSVGLLATSHAKLAFYMLPSRAWELGLGAVIALGGVPVATNRTLRELLTLSGLGLIAFAVLTLDRTSAFPGLNAVAPCVGAALVIAYGAGGRVGGLLGSIIPRAIGKISYSLYLWHWPVAVLARQWIGDQGVLVNFTACLVVALILAVASYRWIETPFRNPWWTRRSSTMVLVVAAMSLLVIGGFSRLLQRFAPDSLFSLRPQVSADLAYLDYDQRPESRAQVARDICFLTDQSASASLDVQTCLSDKPDQPNVLALGDSHLAYLLPGLRAAFPDVHFQQATAAGCTPVRAYASGKPFCRQMLQTLYDRLDHHHYQAIILGARWLDGDIPALTESIRHLKDAGQTVVVIGPAVEYADALPSILARLSLTPNSGSTDPFVRADRRRLDLDMQTVVTQAGAFYVSPQRALCRDNHCKSRSATGAPIAFDYGHYTSEGATTAAQALRLANPGLAESLESTVSPN